MIIPRKSSILSGCFQMLDFWWKLLKFWKFRKRKKSVILFEVLLYELSEREPGGGSPLVAMVNSLDLGPAHIYRLGRRFNVSNNVLYYELLVRYIQSFLNRLKLNFVWISALMLDQTFVNNRSVCPLKWWKMEKF